MKIEDMLEKIPGFEKTPDEIKSVPDANYVCRIADLSVRCGYMKEDAKKIKKLLDERRESLEMVIDLQYELKKFVLFYQDILSEEQKEYYDNKHKKVIELIEKLTDKTWGELNE